MKETSILVFDIETTSVNVAEAELKWFGAYSYKLDKYFLLDYNDLYGIKRLLDSHKILVGFNNKNYDQPILEKYNFNFKYKLIIDLYEICNPKGKNRLQHLGFKLKSYSMREIAKAVLGTEQKGDIDYNIFKKDKWSKEEISDIKKYLKQDLVVTKNLFEWMDMQHAPLKGLLNPKDAADFQHIRASVSSLAYRCICNMSGLPVLWPEYGEEKEHKSFAGGHFINARWERVKGNICYIDFNSCYPHCLFQGNLFSRKKSGWNGDGYFNLEGSYDAEKYSAAAKALQHIYNERVKAKKNKDKIKDAAYKIIINSFYGTIGNSTFKQFYDPIAAGDCTSMGRTLLRKCAMNMERDGYKVLYGFTDGMFVLIPEESSEEELLINIKFFLEDAKKHFPFPADTFDMSIDKRVKFVWFVNKKANCYLWVNQDDTIEYKSTLLNSTAPKIAIQVFDEFIGPRIIKELDVNFTEKEIKEQVQKLLKQDLGLASQEHKVKHFTQYKVKTSMQYQIAEKYGEGTHLLIPNTARVGIGRGKHTLKRNAVRYCTIEEFKQKKLKVSDISLDHILRYLKQFYGP